MQLTVTGDGGDSASSTQQVTVSVLKLPPVASFSFAVNNLDVSFTDTSTDPDGSIATWSWDFGDSATSTSQNPSHSYAAAGTYTVQLTVTDDVGESASSSQQVTVAAGVPVAAVTPSVLVQSVFVGDSTSDTLNIANTGTAPLTYAIAEAAPQNVVLSIVPRKTNAGATQLHPAATSLVSAPPRAPVMVPMANPAQAAASLALQLDDGSYEDAIGWGNTTADTSSAAVYLNRFTAPAWTDAFTIDTVTVVWPSQSSGSMVGKQVRIVAYYDGDGDGDATNAVFLGETSITIASEDMAETYNVSFDVPGSGDVYVGFESQWAEPTTTPLLYAGAIDTGVDHGRSYLFAADSGTTLDYQHLANSTTHGTLAGLGATNPGNWMIRATATTQGGPTASCSNPTAVPWLSVNPASGSVATSGNAAITVGFDSTGMTAGNYTALLCITTNDANNATIEVPVEMDVTACDGITDRIFASNFDGPQACANPDIVTGTINQSLSAADDVGFDFVTGVAQAFSNGRVDDIDLYAYRNKLTVFWYSGQDHSGIGGVADGGGDFKVLQSGDSVGPAQSFAASNIHMNNWNSGADGYIGVAFWNEITGELDYGYIHLTTTAPKGFPVQILEYAYDSSGAAITIP